MSFERETDLVDAIRRMERYETNARNIKVASEGSGDSSSAKLAADDEKGWHDCVAMLQEQLDNLRRQQCKPA